MGRRIARRRLARVIDPSRHHARPPRRARRQHAVVQDQIDARSRNQRGQAFEQLRRLEDEMRCAIGPAATQFEDDLALRHDLKTILPERWAQRVPAQPLQAVAGSSGNQNTRVQVESIAPGMPSTKRRRIREVDRVPPSAHRAPGAWPKRPHATHRRCGETRQHGRLIAPRVRRRTRRPLPRPGTARDRTQAHIAAAAADSTPTAAPAHAERHDRPDAPPGPSCDGRHSSDRSRALCTRRAPTDLCDRWRSEIARNLPRDSRTSGNRGTRARQTVASPARRALPLRRRGTSRSDRAPIGAGRPARAGAADRRMRHAPPRPTGQGPCPRRTSITSRNQ